MPSKLHINTQQGLIEVEGDEKVVLAVYSDLKDLIKARLSATPTQHKATPAPSNAELNAGSFQPPNGDEPKKKRRSGKSGGPSCASRILELKESGHFSELRDAKAVSEALSAKGHNYEGKHIAAALIDITKRGALRRIKKDGGWSYQNP